MERDRHAMNTKLIFIQKVVAEAIAGRNKGGAMHQERHTKLFTAIAVGLASPSWHRSEQQKLRHKRN